MLTDIEGSTRLLHRLGAERYAVAQSEHRNILRDAFRANNGVEVDTQGDAFFYVFPSTMDCLKAAIAGTRGLAAFPFSHGDAVKVRMGMHTGVPQPTDEGYVGIVVNTAARVSGIGHGGQILLSEEARERVLPGLDEAGVSLRDLGRHRLKDLDEPQHLFQVVIPELPSDFPPPRSAESRPNNLPVPLTPFIGRAREVAQVRDLLETPTTRAVTLLGPGGTGKSRLGLRVANEVLHSLEDGAFFVGLAAVSDPELVLPAIASALALKEEPGRPLSETLIDYLRPKEMLLLIDNFEQVQSAARDVARLLVSCAGLKVLVTSRQPLRISGERVFRVPTMSMPEEDAGLEDVEALKRFEAVGLFLERAEAACGDFELSGENAADVVAICRRLDGLPLAIELATAKLFDMTTSQLLKALNRRFEVLTDGAVDLLDHQQTLRDLIAWSYDLLDDRERQLWRRVSIFVGGASIAAVEHVCNPDGQYVFPRDLDSLVSQSLLNLVFDGVATHKESEDGGQRISMLESIREYGLEQLQDSSEVDEIESHYRDWYGAFAREASLKLRSREVQRWLKYLDLDQGNLRAVMHDGLVDEKQAARETAAEMAGNLWFYWYEKGRFSEGRDWLERAVAADVSPIASGRSLLGLANLDRVQNHLVEAKSHCEKSLELFRLGGDEEGAADALSQLGAICQYLGEPESAEAYLDESVAMLRQLEATRGLSFALVLLGALKQLRGDLDGAETDYGESLELARKLGDANSIATSLVNLGEVYQLQGKVDQAAMQFRESLSIFHALGVRNAVAHCLEMLAGIQTEQARHHDAVTLFAAASVIREALGTPIESFNKSRYDDQLAACRSMLGTDGFRDSWSRGLGIPLDDVVSGAARTKG